MSGALQLNSDVMILYKPLSNPFLDKYMKKGRERFGTELIPIENIARAFNKKKGGKFYSILVADQSPGNARGAVWLNFLNQDTATLRGPEVLARKYDMPVVYLNIQKKKRGYYEIIPQLVTKNPKETSEHEITKRFMKMLEKNICEHPEYWLWSHRRWKKKRKNPEYE
jgi:KDO2-lipid IV(A) lauroyltransferase